MFIVFPLVTCMDQIEKLKLFPCLFLNNYLIPYNYKRRHYETSAFLEKKTFVTIFQYPENASNLRRFSDALTLISKSLCSPKQFQELHEVFSLSTCRASHIILYYLQAYGAKICTSSLYQQYTFFINDSFFLDFLKTTGNRNLNLQHHP